MKNMVHVMRLGAIREWKKIGEHLYVGETTYQARSWKKSRRIIAVKKEEIFFDGHLFEHKGFTFSCYVTNLNWQPEAVVRFYNGWGKMLSSSFIANEIIFLITMLTYNLTKFYQSALLDASDGDKTILRLRERYILQAALITRSGRKYSIHFAKDSPLREVNALLEAS